MRRRVRAARRALDPATRELADARIRALVRTLPVYRAARRVAMFFAFDGEPDLTPLLRFDTRKQFFAPVIAGNEMRFARIDRDTQLVPSDFGIPEPSELTLIDPRSLDLVLTPLVAFDRLGHRIGVGAGYYDRCFQFLLGREHWYKPKLVATAYSLQQVDPIDPNPWDVPLWGAVTEQGFSNFAGSR